MGLLKFPDREGYLLGEYNNTADLMMPQFYETSEEAQEHFRSGQWAECSHNPETWVNVQVYAHWGSGHWWTAKACPICNIMTTNHEWPEEVKDPHEGCPDWCAEWCR